MNALKLQRNTQLKDATLILAFSGWMDGGAVSTGTVNRLVELFSAEEFATIDSDDYYLFNFPGSMEMSSLFRPHIEIEDGLIQAMEMPRNVFYLYEEAELLLFIGKEPNMRWQSFGDHVLDFAQQHNVSRIIFIGSFGGTVPHTRQPRLYATSCDYGLLERLNEYGIQQTKYSGPASFTSYLMTRAPQVEIEMFSIIAEIPSYLHGKNPMCIEAVTSCLSKVLQLPLDVNTLRDTSTNWEIEISKMIENDPELSAKIRELENDYDNELIGLPQADFPHEEFDDD